MSIEEKIKKMRDRRTMKTEEEWEEIRDARARRRKEARDQDLILSQWVSLKE